MIYRKKRYFIIIFLALFLVLIAIGIMGWHFMLAAKPLWQTTKVVRKSLINEIIATGTLDAVQKVDVGAQVNGQLKTITVQIGDNVHKNQLLGIIDPRQAMNQVKESEGALLALKAQQEKEKTHYTFLQQRTERERKLVKTRLISQQEFDNSYSQMQMSRFEIQNIDAQIMCKSAVLDTAKTNLDYTKITAPISGIVTKITTYEGQTVIAAQQAPDILTLANMDTMLVNTQVSEADVLHLQPGQTVWFNTLGDQAKKYSGRLKDILPTPIKINDAVFYQARFEVPNPSHTLRLDMTVQTHITLASAKNVLTIPLMSLGSQVNEVTYHIITLENGKPVIREVVTGIKNYIDVQVLSGLREGNVVVLGVSESDIEN